MCQGPAVAGGAQEVVTRVTKTQTWFSQRGPVGPKAQCVNTCMIGSITEGTKQEEWLD